MADQREVERRGVLRAAAGGLSTVPVLSTATGTATASTAPSGVHVGYGADPATTITVGWTGGWADDAAVEYAPVEAVDDRLVAPGDRSDLNRILDDLLFGLRDLLSGVASAVPASLPGEGLVAYRAAMDDLEPATEYAYRVTLDGERSPAFRVRTAPRDPETSFRVTAWGDHGIADDRNPFQRPETDDPNRNVERAAALEPDVHLGVGDIAYANGVPSTWERYFDEFEPYFASTPQMTVPGNHEREPGTGLAQYDDRLDALMPSGAGRRWYDFRYGNAVFVGLNSEAHACPSVANGEERVPITDLRCDDAIDPVEAALTNEDQARYLRRTLEAAAADPDVTWTVVYQHSGLWTGARHDGREDLRDLWGDVIDEFAVDLVVAGHNHVYERSKPIRGGEVREVGERGTTHVVVGAAGTSFYEFDEETPPAFTAARTNEVHGTFAMDVEADRIRCRFVAIDGETVDAFEIVKDDDDGAPIQRELADDG